MVVLALCECLFDTLSLCRAGPQVRSTPMAMAQPKLLLCCTKPMLTGLNDCEADNR
jgi:hypothetical protein